MEDVTEEGRPPGLGDGGRALAGGAARLTDRDKDLLGLFALARYLTAKQVHRLAFAGKNMSVVHRRLAKLSREVDGQPAFLRQRTFKDYDGNPVVVWAPTPHAMPAALARGALLPDLPRHDVGADFLGHLVQLNELLVELWSTGVAAGRWPKAAHPHFRWTPSDCVRLSWGEWEIRQGRRQQRVIRPDAVLEVPTKARRYFLECEMGTNNISPGVANTPDATVNKSERYHTFLTGMGGSDARRTHHAIQYPDGFSPEVLFLVLNEGRAASVNAALATWRAALRQGSTSSIRALTFEQAVDEFRTLVGNAVAEPPAVPATSGPNWTPPFRQSQARALARFARQATKNLQTVRRQIRALPEDVRKRHGLAEPQYPDDLEKVYTLVERLASEGWL
jgi:hypothetical protein